VQARGLRTQRAGGAVRIREDMRLAHYWHDAGLHKKAVDEMVMSTLEDYRQSADRPIGSRCGCWLKNLTISTEASGPLESV
jgi:hypothetical protein